MRTYLRIATTIVAALITFGSLAAFASAKGHTEKNHPHNKNCARHGQQSSTEKIK